ncbi:MAG: hypothetical protein HQK49_22615 [Oligoflexia bacterium]|nr:hypothetical protein [Oligoflexia bacterium]
MSKTNNQNKEFWRINLDEDVYQLIIDIQNQIKNDSKHLKISPSKIGNWIIKIFHQKYFKKEKEALIEAFFDKKEFINEYLKGLANDENLIQKMEEAIAHLRGIGGMGVTKGIVKSSKASEDNGLKQKKIKKMIGNEAVINSSV